MHILFLLQRNLKFISFILLLLKASMCFAVNLSKIIDPCPVSQMAKILPEGWPLNNGLIVSPNAGRKPWLLAIGSAKKTIYLTAYRLSDPAIVKALCDAASRGVKINVLLEQSPLKHGNTAGVTSPVSTLAEAGIYLHTLAPFYKETHYKTILIDERWALISTANLDAESFDGIQVVTPAPCRNFTLVVTQPTFLSYLKNIIDADMHQIKPKITNSQIIVGPEVGKSFFLELIQSAEKSIKIYQQSIQDQDIAEALIKAAKQGVAVELLMMPHPFGKNKPDLNRPNQLAITHAGGKIFLHNHHYIHAKVMVIDENTNNKIMYLGSANFYTPSLETSRELGILTTNNSQIATLLKYFAIDKEKSTLLQE